MSLLMFNRVKKTSPGHMLGRKYLNKAKCIYCFQQFGAV